MPKDTKQEKQEKRSLRLRVVLDTNVYASAFNFPHGKVASIWEHALKADVWTLFVNGENTRFRRHVTALL